MAESYNICLDVGGTKVLGAIFNEKDKIIYRLKKRSKSGGEGTSSQEALYRYFSKRKVSLHPPQPEVVLSAGVKDKSVPEEKGGLFGWLRKFRKT